MQKSRRIDPEDARSTKPVYEEPRRAVAVAINGKFSLTAVGTYRLVVVYRLTLWDSMTRQMTQRLGGVDKFPFTRRGCTEITSATDTM